MQKATVSGDVLHVYHVCLHVLAMVIAPLQRPLIVSDSVLPKVMSLGGVASLAVTPLNCVQRWEDSLRLH